MHHQYQTASVDETAALARRLGGALPARVIVLLIGPLGSGKTTFVRGLVSARSADYVSSPTFVYHQRYVMGGDRPASGSCPQSQGVIDHVDLYRVQSNPSLLRLRSGIDELLADVPGWLLIEWPLFDLVYPADVPRLTVTAGNPVGRFLIETDDRLLATRLNQRFEGGR